MENIISMMNTTEFKKSYKQIFNFLKNEYDFITTGYYINKYMTIHEYNRRNIRTLWL